MALQFVRALWGGTLLLAARVLLARCGLASSGAVGVARLLGARHLVEVLILSRRPGGAPPRWSVIVDGAHAASMVGVGAVSPRLRCGALASAGTAALLAGWTEAERRRG